jgi:hypothetical protein
MLAAKLPRSTTWGIAPFVDWRLLWNGADDNILRQSPSVHSVNRLRAACCGRDPSAAITSQRQQLTGA